MPDVIMLIASTVLGGLAGWVSSVVHYRQKRQLRQDDSAEASLASTSNAISNLRAAYLQRESGRRLRRAPDVRLALLEANVDAAVTLTADEQMVRLVASYKKVGRAHASRDPDTGVETEETAYSDVTAHMREQLRRAREV